MTMERYYEIKNYATNQASDAVTYLSGQGETIAGVIVAVLVGTVAFIGLKAWNDGEGLRIMRRAKHLQEEKDLADRFTEVIDKMNEEGKLTVERVHYWTKRLGKSFKLADLAPRVMNKTLKREKIPAPEAVVEAVVEVIVKPKESVLTAFKEGKAA